MHRSIIALAAFAVACLASAPAHAAWYLGLGDYQLTGTAFGPNADGMTIKFENDGPGAVKVTIANNTSNSPISNVHIKTVVFNLKDAFFGQDGTPLVSVSYVSGKQAENVDISHNDKHIEINPERFFDVGFDFFPGLTDGFVSGMTSVYRFTSSVVGFNENAFKDVNLGADPDFVGGVHYGHSEGSGKSAGFKIHILQGGQDVVPLPSSAICLLLVGLCLGIFRTYSPLA